MGSDSVCLRNAILSRADLVDAVAQTFTGGCEKTAVDNSYSHSYGAPSRSEETKVCYVNAATDSDISCSKTPVDPSVRRFCPCAAASGAMGEVHSCTVAVFRESCTMTCDRGWNANTPRSMEFTCNNSGAFEPPMSGALNCSQVRCTVQPDKLPHTEGDCARRSPLPYKEKCTAQCAKGYTGADQKPFCDARPDGQPKFTTNESNVCEPCRPGMYKNEPGPAECIPCGKGYYSNQSGDSAVQAACKPCPVGRYSNITVATACQACGQGRSNSKTGSQGESDCKQCLKGRYSNVTAVDKCTPCGPGAYNNHSASVHRTDCIACEAGRYSSTQAAGDCTACESGKWNPDNHAKSAMACRDCEPGKYSHISGLTGPCKDCPSGQYADKPQQKQCSKCRNQSDTNNESGTTSKAACKCIAGYTSDTSKPWESSCSPCPIGQYKHHRGDDACRPCEKHSSTSKIGQSSCTCDSGYGANPWKELKPCEPAPCLDMPQTGEYAVPGLPDPHAFPAKNTHCRNKKYLDQCYVDCSRGGLLPGSSRVNFSCSAAGPGGRGTFSNWTGHLNCSEPDCHQFNNCDNFDKPEDCRLFLFGGKNTAARADIVENDTVENSCEGYLHKNCSARCINNFYGHPEDASDTREPVMYSCRRGHFRTSPLKGVWSPLHSGRPLKCRPGILSVNNSRLEDMILRNKAGLYRQSIQSLKGYMFGAGPTYSFTVQAQDVQGNDRNYTLLKKAGLSEDYVVAVFHRVPLHKLPSSSRHLQPTKGKIDPSRGTWGGAEAMPYDRRLTSTKDKLNIVQEGDGQGSKDGGKWSITHQFEEHGVFYISIYMCASNSTADCDDTRPNALINGTGMPAIDHNMFTVCPQNTQTFTPSEVYKGGNLSACRAIGGLEGQGFFNPHGPGRIAAYCSTGFLCNNDGTTWPIAGPNYWVSDYLQTVAAPGDDDLSMWLPLMGDCKGIGACPGSTLSHAECPADDDPNNLYDFENITGVDPSRVIQNPCYDKPLSPPSRNIKDQCRDVVGSRCCRGFTSRVDAPACSVCCEADDRGPEHPSCDGRRWHSYTPPQGQFKCVPCAPQKEPWELVVIGILMLIIAAPVIDKLSGLAHHAQQLQGPFLSIVNFLQSSNLLISLHFSWPQEFKDFAQKVASWFNFNITGILSAINSLTGVEIPDPDCVMHLTYQRKWHCEYDPLQYIAHLAPNSICGLLTTNTWCMACSVCTV